MIMMNGDSPVPGSSPSLPTPAALPSSSGSLDTAQFPNGPPPCAGCGQPIRDEFILRVQGQLWHAQCLCCAACQTTLAHTCYVRGSRVFCRTDFFRLFGASCAGCGEVIPPSEVVRTAHDNIYHLACFVCVVCSSPLHTGDQFYLRDDGKLICKRDFHGARDWEAQAAAPAGSPEGNPQDTPYHSQQPTQPALGHFGSLAFTPQETEILQNVCRACPNPSHDVLQQISSQHGLDLTRVRMWFHAHRKERGRREEGMERAVAPPVSSTSSGRLPSSSRSDIIGDVPFPVTSSAASCARTPHSWPLSDELWSSDFVPPNVDLDPSDIKNGEVCSSRRGAQLPPCTALTPTNCGGGGSSGRGQYYFVSGSVKGGDCQPESLTSAQGHGEVALSWVNS